VLALWGVVISAVYMLRAYRAIFMGKRSSEHFRDWNDSPDLAPVLRIPIILLLAVTLVVGCYPNSMLRVLRPTFSAPVVSTTR
jgi:NADH-quinone oxidoreductase subunit M